MAEKTPKSPGRWLRWPVKIGVFLTVGGVTLWLISAVATGAGILPFRIGLMAAALLFFCALLGLALLFAAVLGMAFKRRWYALRWTGLGIVLGLGFAGYFASWINQSLNVPAIHDISTDLSNPPDFATLTLRADNREVVPDGDRADLADLDNAARWRRWHEEAYADIQPIIVPVSVPDAVAAAEQLVADRGWELAVADPATGRVEATDTVSIYRFKDDVVLRIIPNADGEGSVVNMRSVSRVGVSDLGVNGDRIRAFLADLAVATAG